MKFLLKSLLTPLDRLINQQNNWILPEDILPWVHQVHQVPRTKPWTFHHPPGAWAIAQVEGRAGEGAPDGSAQDPSRIHREYVEIHRKSLGKP